MKANMELDEFDAAESDAHLEYRALSAGAVASLVLGLMSVITIPTALTSVTGCLMVCPIPVAGLLLGIRSFLKIRALPQELTGSKLAACGAVLSAGFLIGGLTLASYVYATEVPDGYRRTTFLEMKPNDDQKNEGIVVPPEVAKLAGQRVFIKGYMRPPSQTFQIDSFLLVRDNNECCFGKSLPEYFDRVQVHLLPPLRTDYSTRMFRLAGTLQIDPTAAGADSNRPVFSLQADYVK